MYRILLIVFLAVSASSWSRAEAQRIPSNRAGIARPGVTAPVLLAATPAARLMADVSPDSPGCSPEAWAQRGAFIGAGVGLVAGLAGLGEDRSVGRVIVGTFIGAALGYGTGAILYRVVRAPRCFPKLPTEPDPRRLGFAAAPPSDQGVEALGRIIMGAPGPPHP